MNKEQIQQIMEVLSEAAKKDKEKTARAISEVLEKPNAGVAFVMQMLNKRPDVSISTLIKSASLYKSKEIMDEKTAELIAISSAVANGAKFCMDVHMRKAFSLGATEEEVFNTILISSAVCETSAWATAFREFQKLEGKENRKSNKKKSSS